MIEPSSSLPEIIEDFPQCLFNFLPIIADQWPFCVESLPVFRVLAQWSPHGPRIIESQEIQILHMPMHYPQLHFVVAIRTLDIFASPQRNEDVAHLLYLLSDSRINLLPLMDIALIPKDGDIVVTS